MFLIDSFVHKQYLKPNPMATSSLTKVIEVYSCKNENDQSKKIENVLINMYYQCNGCIDKYGKDLAMFLQNIQIGYENKFTRGATCLSAQIVAHFKKEPGSIYLYPINANDCGQRYEYFVTVNEFEKTIGLRVYETFTNKTIFEGHPKELLILLEKVKTTKT